MWLGKKLTRTYLKLRRKSTSVVGMNVRRDGQSYLVNIGLKMDSILSETGSQYTPLTAMFTSYRNLLAVAKEVARELDNPGCFPSPVKRLKKAIEDSEELLNG